MIYFYQRVSSQEQSLSRQTEAIEKWEKENNLKVDIIFSDKQSGKNFDRPNYQELRRIIKKGDLLIVKSIDRIGRNYDGIIEEWTYLTKTIGADILVLDTELLDTREKNGQSLTGRFISDLFLQVLSYVAQNERENIKSRQREGIDIALRNGTKFGRKETYNEEFRNKVKCDYLKGMTYVEMAKKYGCSKDRIIVWKRKYGWER